MRRGHAGIGGWRNENPRHFRPRGGGTPHYRPPRGYGLLDTPRFPPPGPRPLRGPPPFGNRPNVLDNRTPDHDRSKYRHDNRQNNQFRPQNHHPNQRSIFPLLDRMRQQDVTDHANQYKDNSYYENPQRELVNSMGDVDHRLQGSQSTIEPYSGHPAWSRPPEMCRQYDDRQAYHKSLKHHDPDVNKIPSLDYSGHRPPASDHYGGNASSSIDNSNAFSRSVDDTVDIVRRRLQSRADPQTSGDQSIDHKDEDMRIASTSQSYQNPSEAQPAKKRTHRQKHRNIESNCDKIKSKIVHELFKMDKGRIHKLMDNPSSSTKFEYAISSLINESQNSLNKHMRSVAEKSLCTSEDFIRNDNNTIYEDTFMKQMQYILEPQDTVLLEDIKPLVMEELSKVLQLSEYDQPFPMVDEHSYPQQRQEQIIYDSYTPSHPYDYNDYENNYYEEVNSPATFEDYTPQNDEHRQAEFSPVPEEKPEPLFERRSRKKSTDHSHERIYSSEERSQSRANIDIKPPREELPTFSIERRPSRRSMDSRHSEDKHKESKPQVPLFDSNTQFSEEDDPFAELDRQYHVAVDHTFMESYDLCSPQQTPTHNTSTDSTDNKISDDKSKTQNKPAGNIKKEIDNQLLDMAKSPLKLLSNNREQVEPNSAKSSNQSIKKEIQTPTKDPMSTPHKATSLKQESSTESSSKSAQKERSENVEVSSKSSVSSSSRKRSVDQRPSHRKEKRKKSDTTQPDANQQILNKNIIINVNDCATKDKEKCTESAKSIFNLFFSKNENSNEVPKKVDSTDKNYSDKYVKRKEPSKKKESEEKKKHISVSTSHSIVIPKDSATSTQATKTDQKTKLKTIDMFIEQPRKPTTQAPKNSVLLPTTPVKVADPIKTKQAHTTGLNRKPAPTIATKEPSRPGNRKILIKEPETLESKSFTSRFCQTVRKRYNARGVQTDPVKFEKSPSKATDAFERMKEIDMEIQVLLQEKFKLYSSLESNPSCPNTMQATLGMTVLNVPINEASGTKENTVSEEDAIVEDFTNIPVEELEQIAMESVEHTGQQSDKRSTRNRLLDEERQSSASPTVKKYNRKPKTPNISLLEQIIDDDTPLEDIISLDDLEITPVKPKKKGSKSTKKKYQKKNKPLTKIQIAHLLYNFGIKDCYVLLERKDLSMYMDHPKDEILEPKSEKENQENDEVEIKDEIINSAKEDGVVAEATEEVEETVVENDLQLDMMDVSEDIIIGDNCEVKCNDDKEAEKSDVAISEDIILDNSQPSEPNQAEGGQNENVCKMYDYSTDENLRRDAVTVSGHADAVLAIECIENNFVAACLDGNVYYFSGDGQLLSTLRGSNFAVTCLTIVKGKYETTVYTGSLDSRIRYYDLETGLEKGPECNVLSPIQTMDRAWDTIFVGTRTGFVLQFECKNNMLIPVSTVKFSDQSILALRAMKEGPRKVLLVAARSEDVTIKDAQTGLLLRTLQGPKMTVYTLLYEDGKVYCGTSSHQIHVFDYTSGSHAGVHEGGKGAVCLRATGGLLLAGCYDGCVYVYREGEPRPLAQLRGPSLMLLSLAVVGSKIIAGYKDRSLYIWKIPLSILQEMIL